MSVDPVLTQITDSLKATIASVDNLSEFIDSFSDNKEAPNFIKELIKDNGNKKLEGVSLLSLKNHALLSYLNNLALILGSRLGDLNDNKDEKIRNKAIENSIVDRVILDRGVKSLEKKLNYQLTKLVSSYQRREKEQEDELNPKKSKKSKKSKSNNDDESDEDDEESEDEEDEEDDEDDDEDEESEEEDGLSYRPDASSLLKQSGATKPSKPTKTKKVSRKRRDSNSEEEEEEESEEEESEEEEGGKASKEKYRPPKISAMLPPQTAKSAEESENLKEKRVRNLQSMDEYLQDIGDAPLVEHSIGSTILEAGRGGIKTDKDRKKEAEIQRYEEDNFIRLPTSQTKISFKEKMKKKQNEFFGEDWSIFNNSRDFNESSSRTAKRSSSGAGAGAWDRAKAKRRRN